MSDSRQFGEKDFTAYGSRVVNDVFLTEEEEMVVAKNNRP